MNRLSPIFAIGLLFLGGTAFAQSFEPPSNPDLSGILDHAFSQIDPPSLQIDVGPSDDDIAEAQEAITNVISEALVATGGGVSVDHTEDGLVIEIELPTVGIHPTPEKIRIGPIKTNLNPDLFNPDIFGDTDPGVALTEILAVIEEAVEAGLQQGRVLLDSDFGP